MLFASMRNSALYRSVMRKFFASERFEVNRCGPRNESKPMLPSVPAAGRENAPPEPPTASGVGRGVNQWRFETELPVTPRGNEPDARLGRQSPTSSSRLHWL